MEDGRIIPAFLRQALRGDPLTIYGDGSQTRSFCYVSDMIDGLLSLSTSEERLPVNLGDPTELTILDLVEEIRTLMARSLQVVYHPLPADDPRRRRPDITKARQILGWEPRTTLEEGLRMTLAYFMDAPPEFWNHESEPDFALRFDPALSPAQVKDTLVALADYFRACGGFGLRIDPELQEVIVKELLNA